jgi:hypothetical protein
MQIQGKSKIREVGMLQYKETPGLNTTPLENHIKYL